MAGTFKGKASIVQNRKGLFTLKADVDGKWNAENAAECLGRLVANAKLAKADIKEFTVITPEGVDKKAKLIPVLLANRYGAPYIGMLPEQEAGKGKKLQVFE